MTARPHCRTPGACQAKGAGHCRGCAGAAHMAAMHADPERKAAWREKIEAASRTPERRELSRACMERNLANPVIRERIAENGRRQVAALAELRVERSAAALGIAPDLVPEVRRLQTKGFSAKEAAALLRRSRIGVVQAGRAG